MNGNGNTNGFLKAVDKVEEIDVSFVRIFWVTHSGQYRCRVSFMFHTKTCFFFFLYSYYYGIKLCQNLFQAIPRKHFYDTVTKNGVALPPVTMVMSSLLEKPAPGSGVGFVGEARVTPDLSTIRTIPWYLLKFFGIILCLNLSLSLFNVI